MSLVLSPLTSYRITAYDMRQEHPLSETRRQHSAEDCGKQQPVQCGSESGRYFHYQKV